jgi:chromosome segregation ATPase
MPSDEESLSSRINRLERSVKKLETSLIKVSEKVARERREARKLAKKMDTRIKREEMVMDALGMSSRTKKGDKASLGKLNDSIVKLEEYLLRTSERIDNILNSLKNHREFLVRMNRKVYKVDTRERIGMELDIMKNTLAILAMGGVSFNESLLREIEKLRAASDDPSVSPADLRKSKEKLDKKFGNELERYDLDTIWKRRKDIPGYI